LPKLYYPILKGIYEEDIIVTHRNNLMRIIDGHGATSYSIIIYQQCRDYHGSNETRTKKTLRTSAERR
jgi:hypothetical protein